MMRMLGSLLFWGFMTLSSVLLFPVAFLVWLVSVPFDRRRWLIHRFTSLWASLYTWLNPAWRVRVIGRERLYEDGPTVLVANHNSLVDILVLFRLQSHFRWVSKQENFRVPFVGWNMTLCDYIPIRRGDAASVQSMMRHCDRALADGNSIFMFPEGTRSTNGRLRSFKLAPSRSRHAIGFRSNRSSCAGPPRRYPSADSSFRVATRSRSKCSTSFRPSRSRPAARTKCSCVCTRSSEMP